MSQYGREFRLSWITAKNAFTVRVSIYETDNLIPDDETPEVIELTPAGTPLVFSTIDNDRNKFTPVRAKQATISFLTGDYDINTFFDSPDNLWLCVITLPDSGVTLFNGFIELADISQPFLPDPVTVTLTATDKLGSLRDVPIVGISGDVQTGKVLFSIWIADACRLTGLSLPFKVQYNIREIDSNDFHLFWKNYLDALTFEDEPGTLINAREVLEKILGETAFLTQYKGEWWVKRVDEFDFTRLDYVASFDTDGNYESIDSGTTYSYNIGALSDTKWIDANQILSSDRKHDFIKLEYRYESPHEIPCNIDYERGDFIADLPDETVEAGEPDEETFNVKSYELDCWVMERGNPMAPSAPTVDAYIKRRFNDYEVEKQRFIVIPEMTDFTNYDYVRSQPIPVSVKDKVTFSVDWRLGTDISLGPAFDSHFSLLILEGDDGNWYKLANSTSLISPSYNEEDFYWYNTAGFTLGGLIGFMNYDSDSNDETEWKTQSWDAPPVPVSGKLYILLYPFGNPSNHFEVMFGNLNFELIPYINGTYKRYVAQSHEVSTSDDGYLASKDKEVYISDSPHPMFKGAIFKFDSDLSKYVLTTQFYDHTESPLAVPPSDSGTLLPFGELQARDYWNQYKLGFRIIEGSIYGLDQNNPPDVIHRYIFTNTDPNINGKTFMCVGFEQDWKTERWRGTFVEVYRNSVGRSYDDPAEFKYLTN